MKRVLALSSAALVLAGTAVAGVAVAGVAGAGVAGAAQDDRLRHGQPVYLALGDSVAAGVGSVEGAPADASSLAAWRANGYAALFAGTLEDELDCVPSTAAASAEQCESLQYVNLAVPGATTSTLLAGQLQAAVALIEERAADRNPRNDVEVISLTIGGNDVFTPVLDACVRATDRSGCVAAVVGGLQGFAGRYETVLATLRAAAGPDTLILTMTYDNPLPACDLAAASALAAVVLEGNTVVGTGLPVLPAGLNDLIRAASARHGAVVADTYGVLDPTEDFVGGRDCLHPDASGHAATADVFADAFRAAQQG